MVWSWETATGLVRVNAFEGTSAPPIAYCLISHPHHWFNLTYWPLQALWLQPRRIFSISEILNLFLGSSENMMEALDSLPRKMFTVVHNIHCICMQLYKVHKPLDDRYCLNLVSIEEDKEGWSKLGSKSKTHAVNQVSEEKVIHAMDILVVWYSTFENLYCSWQSTTGEIFAVWLFWVLLQPCA